MKARRFDILHALVEHSVFNTPYPSALRAYHIFKSVAGKCKFIAYRAPVKMMTNHYAGIFKQSKRGIYRSQAYRQLFLPVHYFEKRLCCKNSIYTTYGIQNCKTLGCTALPVACKERFKLFAGTQLQFAFICFLRLGTLISILTTILCRNPSIFAPPFLHEAHLAVNI